MNIYLHKKLFENKSILNELEQNFGGIEADKPDFLLSEDLDAAAVYCEDSDYDAYNTVHKVISFLEENFYLELKSC